MTLEELVRNNMEPRTAKGLGEVWVRCPFCGDEQYRMGINVLSGLAHCFRASCEWKTTDRRYLFKELCKVLEIDERMDDARIKKERKPVPKYRKDKLVCRLPDEFERLHENASDKIERRAWNYLVDRGVTKEQIKKHKLGFCVVGDYAWRIIIPVYLQGKLVSFTGRDFSGLPDIELRYRNFPGKKVVYNIPRVKRHKAILVEGAFDVWAVERAASSNYDVIGRLGAGFTKTSMRELLDYDSITIWPDPDRGGCDLAISAATAFAKRQRKVYIVMPKEDDIDPGKLGETKEGLAEIMDKLLAKELWSDDIRLKLKHFAAFV